MSSYASEVVLGMAVIDPARNQAQLGPPALADASRRDLWLHRTEAWSDTVSRGYYHLGWCALSAALLSVWTAWAFTAGNRAKHNRQHSYLTKYVVVHLLLTGAVLGLLLSVAAPHTTWQECLANCYLLTLEAVYLVAKSNKLKTALWRHINATVLAFALLESLESLLPLCVIGATHHVPVVNYVQLGCYLAVALVSSVAPRTVPDVNLDVDSGAKSPEETCSWLSYYASYEWLTYLMLRGFSRELTLDDLPALPAYDAPILLLQRLHKARAHDHKNILRTLARAFSREIRNILAWSVATGMVEHLGPLSVYHLLSYLDNPDYHTNTSIVHPFVWIVLLFVGPVVRSACYQRSTFVTTRLRVLFKAAVVQEVYHKILISKVVRDTGAEDDDAADPEPLQRISSRSEVPGNVLDAPLDDGLLLSSDSIKPESLVSYDADCISNLSDVFYAVTGTFFSTAVAITMLHQILGWPSYVGIAVLAIFTPLSGLLSDRLSQAQRFVMEATDARLDLVDEYLHAIKAVKYFGWTAIAVGKIAQARKAEQQRLWRRNLLSVVVALSGDLLALSSLLAMFTFLVFFTDTPLRAPAAFTALSITETLRTQYVWLTKVVQWVAQGRESARRIDTFLNTDNDHQPHPFGPPEFVNATFRVAAPAGGFHLRELNVKFEPNKLNVILGPMGAGKSSLLLSLLNETILESGSAFCPQDVAYVPEVAWLENTTVRENIVFYGPFDEERYHAVLHACDLDNDIAHLSEGDATHVGEGGASLSGGQKQRVSLARALYSRASTLLLDDIFTALDATTTFIIYNRCFRSGLLAGRTVILNADLDSATEDAALLVTLAQGVITKIQRRKNRLPRRQLDTPALSRSPSTVAFHSVAQSTASSATVLSDSDDPPVPAAAPGKVPKKTQTSGRVPRKFFWKYLWFLGGYPAAFFAVLTTLLVQTAYFSTTLWLSFWAKLSSEAPHHGVSPNSRLYLGIYAGTVFVFLCLQALNNVNYQRGGWRAARTMHNSLVQAVFYAPLTWFDHVPAGQIMNRFGPDTQSLDSLLVDWLRQALDNALRLLLRLAGIASIMPIFALPAALLCCVGFVTGDLYSRAEVAIKRMCGVSFSPIFSHLHDTTTGLPIIRGRRNLDAVFQERLADRLAVYMKACEAQYNCNRWVSIRSDLCAATIAAATGVLAYRSGSQTYSAGIVAFSLTNAIGLSQTILTLVRNMNDLEVEMNSFKRLVEYMDLPPEPDVDDKTGRVSVAPPAGWPYNGLVEFSHLSVRYGPEGADVLHDLNLTVRPGERVAIVGRTGSGKSTLVGSLLRAAYISAGAIRIDGIDIGGVPLQRLRTSFDLIPQETTLFSGDVRSNIDPEGVMDDAEMDRVLAACSDGNETLNLHAHTPVALGGRNFSSGQRQVLGLARALCRRAKIVILDEATATVDAATYTHMQHLIRTSFGDSTVITIVHRLQAILDYDRVVVLGDGQIIECGSPAELIKGQGALWELLHHPGEDM